MESKNLLSKYLEERSHSIPVKQPSTVREITNDEDEEIWFCQIPKTINRQELVNHKMKMPGKAVINNTEIISKKYPTPRETTIAYKDENAKYKMKSLPIIGNVILREALNIEEENDIGLFAVQKKANKVSFPENIRDRHPLHGKDYKERIELKDDLKQLLKDCDEKSQRYIFSSSKQLKLEIKTEPIDKEYSTVLKDHKNRRNKKLKKTMTDDDDDDDFIKESVNIENGNEYISIKKEKQDKKRQLSDDEFSGEKKKKKKLNSTAIEDEESMELSWLKAI